MPLAYYAKTKTLFYVGLLYICKPRCSFDMEISQLYCLPIIDNLKNELYSLQAKKERKF